MLVSPPIEQTLSKRRNEAAPEYSRPLHLHSLSLHHFRNYASARLELSPLPVVLTGRNGAGKTNILEAISLLMPGKGLRRAALSEIDNRSEPGHPWAVAVTMEGMRGEVKIGTGRDPQASEERRIVHIDENPARSQAELTRHAAMIWLTPQMEQLFNEGASAGRKFLDRLVYSFDPEHAARVNEYEFAMRERNKLLQTGRGDANWCAALELTMAETASAIASARISTIGNIHNAMAQSRLSFPKAQITAKGFAEDRFYQGQTAIEVEEALKVMWAGMRSQEVAVGRTMIGAHRTELHVRHTVKDMPAEACSTGEQKALLLSIVLAQARAGALWRGIIPVLLLDEVVAHLDATRRLELFEEICQIGAQTWMTGTDDSLFAELKEKAQFFHVDNGHLSSI